MRQLFIVAFTVVGRGEFPLDMLRYDQCHPAGGDDAAMIKDRLVEDGAVKTRRIRLVTRGMPRHWQPTAGRWSSFLWSVDPESIETSPHNV